MPVAILKFNLPEEATEFMVATHGMDWALCVFDLAESLRNKLKYENLPEDKAQIYTEIRKELYNILEVRGVSLDMIE